MGLRCCVRAFSSCGERRLLFIAVRGLHCGGSSRCGAWALGARASVVVDRGLWSAGSVVVAHGLSCSTACGIFPDQGSNPCPLHWQADCKLLRHQGSPPRVLLKWNFFASITSSRTPLSVLSITTVLFKSQSSPAPRSAGCRSRVSSLVALLTFPCSAISSRTSFCSTQIPLLALSLLLLCYIFIFVGQCPLSVIYFCKILCRFITGRQEVRQPQASLSECELNNRCTVTNHQGLWKKRHDGSLTLMLICYLCSDLWTEELEGEISILCNYSQLIYHSNWNLNPVWRIGVI